MKEEGFRADINALRALAVLAVIAFHFGVPGAGSGYVGVDIFFVISGYLIGGQIGARLDAGRFSLASFFASRVRRIVPALVAACAVVLLWGWFFQLPDDYRELIRSALNSVDFLSNRYFSRQLGYFDLGASHKPLLHTWSLSVEGQFYLFLPFAMLLGWRLPRAARPWLVLLIAAGSFAAAISQGRESVAHVFFSFSGRIWEFLLGASVAWFLEARLRRMGKGPVRQVAAVAAWLALAAACAFIPLASVWPGPWTLLPTLLTAAVIAAGCGAAPGRVVTNRVVQHIGDISYSLYLWHWPVIACWRITLLQEPGAGELLLLLGVTWLLAFASWRWVEQPFRRGPAWQRPRRLLISYAVAAAAMAGFSHVVSAGAGLPWRLPSYMAGAIEAEESKPRGNAGCWDLPGVETKLPHDACDVGDPRAIAPTFAVWGDSHALQYLHALRQAAAARHVSGLLFHWPGCEPTQGPAVPGQACEQHNREVLRILSATPSIRTVLLSIRQNDSVRVARTWQMARDLASRGLRVIFTGPLPEGPWPVTARWAAQELLQREFVADMTIARAAPSRVASFDERLAQWRNGAAGGLGPELHPVDLTPLFCDSALCWLVRAGEAQFWDADHLTREAAARVVGQAVSPLLFANR